jgi:methionyl-tRNA synthetase
LLLILHILIARVDCDAAIVPRQRQEEILDYLSDEASVQDLSVSRLRSRVEWGLQVPDDPLHTIYVWLDALTSYMTAVGLPWDNKTEMRASGWPADIHVVGKDILR